MFEKRYITSNIISGSIKVDSLSQLVGATGATGPQGATGFTGATGPSGGTIASTFATLAADVQLATSNTWYDILSVSLAAGTYFIIFNAMNNRTATTGGHTTIRITDKTTHYASAQQFHASSSGITQQITCVAVVTLSTTTTIYGQVATTAGSTSELIKAAATSNASGNNVTQMISLKLA